MKIDKQLENEKCYFDFLNISPFSPKGFFTFLVGVAHGAAAAAIRAELYKDDSHLLP